ncbi:MAG: tetratricopeptide repeat protein [Candidatus Solibacter usitatus]|nr:tetratricopeptide repeat protein [Candidatus Solibacter usitatus]
MLRLTGFALAAVLTLPLWAADTVVVLPFFNLSRSKNLDWIGESLAETLLEALAAEGIAVVPQEIRDEVLRDLSVRRYALLTRASVMEIAVNANAGLVLHGEFEATPAAGGGTSKGSVRIVARFLDVNRVRRGPEFNLSGALEDLSALQTSLAWQSVNWLAPQLPVAEDEFRRAHPPVRLDALESYVRGLLATAPDQKHRLFATAARLEPAFSQPCFQLGRINIVARNYSAAAGWFQKVAPADIHYREALFFLGLSRYYSGDFKSSSSVMRKVAAIVPLPEVLNNFGAALLRSGEEGALEAFAKAVEIDPADPVYRFNLGYALWRRAEYDQAAGSLRASLERKPDDETATLLLGYCLKKQPARPGDPRMEALERLKADYNESAWLMLKSMLAPKN